MGASIVNLNSESAQQQAIPVSHRIGFLRVFSLVWLFALVLLLMAPPPRSSIANQHRARRTGQTHSHRRH